MLSQSAFLSYKQLETTCKHKSAASEAQVWNTFLDIAVASLWTWTTHSIIVKKTLTTFQNIVSSSDVGTLMFEIKPLRFDNLILIPN